MASIFSIKNKGFTLLEMLITIFLISFLIVAIGTIYFSIIKANVHAERKLRALENIQLGTEKVWRLLKYSWSIQNLGNGITFKDNGCNTTTIIFDRDQKNILIKDSINDLPLFDPDLVKVIDFKVATDTPSTDQTYAYFQTAPKIIVLYYNLEIKGRVVTSSLIFQQAVAPLNSVYTANKCE